MGPSAAAQRADEPVITLGDALATAEARCDALGSKDTLAMQQTEQLSKASKGKKLPKVALLDDDDWLSPPLLRMLRAVFNRFDGDGDGGLSEAELQAFARTCNAGTELDKDELDQIRQFFDTDDAGRLTLKGFHEMFHMQTTARPADTWKDARALGYNNQLELVDTPAASAAVSSASAAAVAAAVAAAERTASGGEAGMKEALRVALTAVAASPNDPAAHRQCGEALLALGRGEAAARSMGKAAALEHLASQAAGSAAPSAAACNAVGAEREGGARPPTPPRGQELPLQAE